MTGPVVVGLGDSITAGVGDAVTAESAHGPGWAAHLATLTGSSRFENLALNGSRAHTVVETQLDQALAAAPDLATLVVGGNDTLRSDFRPVEVEGHLHTCVRALRDHGADVVLATLPPIGLFELCGGRIRQVMRARIAAVNAAVRATAASAGPRVRAVDLGAAVGAVGLGAWHVDRVHPSPLGHRHLAAAAACALPAELRCSTSVEPGVLVARLPAPPPPPSALQRLAWLTVAGIPWALRRGRDFLPGLVRAVVDDLRGRELAALDLQLSELSDTFVPDAREPEAFIRGT